jgi:phosphatidate cytidylyltransferase
MLRWRLALGSLLIAVVALLCWLDYAVTRPAAVLHPVVVAVALLAAGEVLSLLAQRDFRPAAWSVYLGILLIVGSTALPLLWSRYPADCPMGRLGWPLAALAITTMLVFAAEMRRVDKSGKTIVHVALALLTVVYVAVPSTFLIRLRLFDENRTGMIALVSLIVVVKLCDIGAYALGRLVGRHKMAPMLSPGKTWEGLAGGLVFSCAGSVGIFGWLVRSAGADASAVAISGWIAYGLILGSCAVVGDLAESLLKRECGRKDSSRWMPGFGGVLDVIDSLLFAAPAAYLCWVAKVVQV